MGDEVTTDDSVREAALAAMKEQGITAENWPTDTGEEVIEPEVEGEEEAKPDATAAPEEKDPETSPSPSEEAPARADDDVPTEYFGVDLSDLPSEKRADIIARFKEQDRYVQSVQRKAAELEKQVATPQAEPEPEPEPLSDDAIMEWFGVSPDDEMYDVKKEMMLPIAKRQYQNELAVQQMMEEQQAKEFASHWNSTLDQLEADHGKLPISRDELIDIALENNIFDPVDAYARVHLSGRKTFAAEVEKFKTEAKEAAKKPPATQRPRATEATSAEPPELIDPKEAAKRAAKKLGFDWGDALSNIQG